VCAAIASFDACSTSACKAYTQVLVTVVPPCSRQAVNDMALQVDVAASQQLAAAASETAQLQARIAEAERAIAAANEVLNC
jgi:hypothetical protein